MIRVLVVDDHPVVRKGLAMILAEEPEIREVGEADSAAALLRLIDSSAWDVVVLDISLPDRSGLEVLKDIRAMRPGLPVLILSMHPEDQYAPRVLKAGAAGFVSKESAAEELVNAVKKVVGGGRYVSPSLAERLAEIIDEDYRGAPHERLSDREFQVMRMLAQGKRLKDIADELCLSVKTVSTYRARVLEKMGMESNAELACYAVKNGLME
ncbi:MAG: response regulator transcription factor [Actinobacteria bacterium]|nr:response regulator transcription factor [Actinomycetota bacterium]MDI6832105.1 response regulator transcription factor [Actinomycetota bacterium]